MKFGGQLNVKRVASRCWRSPSEADMMALTAAFEHGVQRCLQPAWPQPGSRHRDPELRARGRVAQRKPERPSRARPATGDPTGRGPAVGERCSAHEDGWVRARPVYDRWSAWLRANVIDGPALIEAEDTTVVVAPGWRCAVDERSGIVLHADGEEASAAMLRPADDGRPERCRLKPVATEQELEATAALRPGRLRDLLREAQRSCSRRARRS